MKSESNVSIHRHTHIHTRTVYAQIICPLHCCCSIRLTQSNRRETIIIYIRSFLSDVHIFLFFHQQYIHIRTRIHLSASSSKKKHTKEIKKKKGFICIDDNDDDLYVLHLTATGEVQQWNPFVDADHRWDRENECTRKREREKRENEKNLTFV